MARVTKSNKNNWVPSLTTSANCNQLNTEKVQIYINEKEKETLQSKMGTAKIITENSPNEVAVVVSEFFGSDTKLEEEYKQLLVKAVAERIKRKMSEKDMWEEIQKETNYNHKIVWNQMRETTLQKIKNLLPANDLVENIPTEMRMSTTDWLLFDLILVHEQIDVLNVDPLATSAATTDTLLHLPKNFKSKEPEPECLQEMFELIKQHDVENLLGDALIAAWTQITLKYNSRGRQCSPMMLQLRWYQLKKQTRCCFYNSYVQQRSNEVVQDTSQPSAVIVLTVLQIAVAVAYNNVIAQECPTWQSLIDERRVMLSEEFSNNILNYGNKTDNSQTPETSNEPSLLLIKLDENQLANDFDKEKCTKDDSIIIDLKDDVEYTAYLQKIINESIESRKQEVETVLDEDIEIFKEKDIEMFKRRLIKEVAKTLELQSKPMIFLWQKLRKQLGRECRVMWGEMRNTTIKKLTHLLAREDMSQAAPTEMQLSETEWLLFDLVLVHDPKIYALRFAQLEAKCLRDLFELVNVHQVEKLEEEDLIEAWINLTLEYNRGGRLCSPMLLQLFWYRLKEMSRIQVFKPSTPVNRYKNKMLIAIATKYQKIITQSWTPWNALVKAKRVVLPKEFIMTIKRKKKWTGVEACDGWYLHVKEEISNFDNDNIIVHQDILTIPDDFILVVSDAVDCISEEKFDKMESNAPNNPIETIPDVQRTEVSEIIELDSDDENDDILCEKADNLASIPLDKEETSLSYIQLTCNEMDINVISEKIKQREGVDQTVNKVVNLASISDTEPILCDSDDEMDKIQENNLASISLEKEETNISNIQLTCDEMDVSVISEQIKLCETVDQTVNKLVNEDPIDDTEPILCDSDDEMDKLLQEKANLMSTVLPKELNTLAKVIGIEVDEFKKANNSKIYGMDVEEVGIISKNTIKTDSQYEEIDEVDFDENNIELVDDGIKFEEDNLRETDIAESGTALSSESDDENIIEESDDEKKIDLKLLMNTSVYTKKIDLMEVFKFIDYESVNDKRIIKYVELESKPIDKRTLKDADIESFREQAIPRYDKQSRQFCNDIEETSNHNVRNSIKYTSWLLQKPKKRKYKNRQLSRNPDFNTTLKRLSTSFLSSTRNKLLLKECQPLTIDLHKAFEVELINGTMNLKRGVFRSVKATEVKSRNNSDVFKIAPPSLPSMFTQDQQIKLAEHVRDLIATMTDDNQDEEDFEISNDNPKLSIRRNKVINLPDKDQIRLINQSLLTAEIMPRHQPLLDLSASNGAENKMSESANTFLSSKESRKSCKRLKRDRKTPNSTLLKPSIYCCWAREKKNIIEQKLNLECSLHNCVDRCTCCCRIDLVIFLKSKLLDQKATSESSPKIFERCNNLNVYDTENNSKVTYSSSFETNNSNKKTVVAPKLPVVRDSVTNYIQNNRPTKPKRLESATKINHEHKAKKAQQFQPIVHRLPVEAVQSSQSVTSYLILPTGVNFVKLVDEKVALAINPGVQLEPKQLQSLMSICASVNGAIPEERSEPLEISAI